MPQRKGESSKRIKQKIKRLEKKLRHERRRGYYSDDSESESTSRSSQHSPSYYQDDEGTVMIDEVNDVDPHSIQNEDLPQPDLEPDSMPSTSNNVSIPSIVVVPPKQKDVPPTTVSVPGSLTAAMDTSEMLVQEGSELDSELLDILGIDPTTDRKYGAAIQNDLAVRLQHWGTIGLPKELRKELGEKYLTPENTKLIEPPQLNAEIKAAVSDIITKRDNAIENKQKHMTSAISCLAGAITLILSSKERDTVLLKLLMDTARIICDCQHADSILRRNFLLSSVKKEVREQVLNTKIDKLLFGENLAETLKSAKAISKSGTELKPSASKPQNNRPKQTSNSSRNLNWRGQGPVRRQTGPPRTKEPAMTLMRNRPASSSKQSQRPPQKQNYDRR